MPASTNSASAHVLQQDDDPKTVEQLRLKLHENGYTPLPNHDKRIFMKGWPGLVVDAEAINMWSRRFKRYLATGVRVEGGLMVMDLDIDHPVIDRIVNAILDLNPKLSEAYDNGTLPIRKGKGFKEAWFLQTDEIFSRIHTRRWIAPGESEDAGTHSVEVFGGASPRQFGAFGWHTRPEDGRAGIRYQYVDDASLLSVCKSELPILAKSEVYAITDLISKMLEEAGFKPVLKSTAGESEAARVYDLTEDMRFDLNTGAQVQLPELRELAKDAEDLRCSASFLEGPSASRTDRCLVSVTRSGNLTIWESSTGQTHMEAALKPRDVELDLDRVAEKLRELDIRTRNVIKPKDGAVVAAAKLRETYAFCPNQTNGVVPIYTTDMESGITMQAFRTMMLPNCDEERKTPTGPIKYINPVDIWAHSEKRVTVRGMRLRPDMPRPIYEEDGARWINTYRPPDHVTEGGEVATGLQFMAHLLPDDDERSWFMKWLAHKVQHPHVPGPAVIMVAREFGTGRGTLAVLLGKLIGQSYVTNLPFHMLTGKSYQSQYDDWGAETLLAIVSEGSESNGGSMYATRHDAYTHLKMLVEPRATMRKFVSKKQHFKAMSFTTYLVSTNDIDALPIPADDRRFAVLSNGEKRDKSFWSAVNRWAEDDANIGAFHRMLLAMDLGEYSPYEAPPRTDAQQTMVDLGRSDLDRGLDIVFAGLKSDVYTVAQVIDRMDEAKREYDLDYPEGVRWQPVAKRMAQKRGYRVGVLNGVNWQPLIAGKRSPVYAKTREAARKWTLDDRLREEVLKNASTLSEAPGSSTVVKLERIRSSGGKV